MARLHLRLIALVVIAVGTSVRIGEAPSTTAPSELAGLHTWGEEGDVEAQLSLGFRYRRGNGVLADDAEAVQWFQAAAEQGHAEAQFNLGFHYREGRGIPQNDTEAVRWYRLAAEQGSADAQNNLGGMYARGDGVSPNGPEATRWCQLAAEQGHAVAQFNLGYQYGDGLGVPRDYVEAVRRYRRAEAPGLARTRNCSALGFLDSGLTVFAPTLPRPARRGRVALAPGFDSRTSPASTVRCTSA